MPVASSSRSYKRTRRAPSSDIEEAGPVQRRRQQEEEDVEMDEEDQPRRQKGKKAKGKKAQLDDSDAEVDEEEEDIPLPELKDHPLDKNYAVKVRGLATDWSTVRDKIHHPSYNLIREVAASVAEFTEGEKGEKGLTQIDNLMRELLDTEYELNQHEKTLDDIYQRLFRNEELEGVPDMYGSTVHDKVQDYKSMTSRQKYAKNDQYQKFKQAVYEVNHPDSAMPPVVDLIPREDGDVSDDEDDDVQVGGVTQDYKCPLTLTHLIDPLTSKLCGHSYSANAIREYLGPGPNRLRDCPATGCHKQISLKDLEQDKDLARRAREAARRERAREHDSDEDELIE